MRALLAALLVLVAGCAAPPQAPPTPPPAPPDQPPATMHGRNLTLEHLRGCVPGGSGGTLVVNSAKDWKEFGRHQCRPGIREDYPELRDLDYANFTLIGYFDRWHSTSGWEVAIVRVEEGANATVVSVVHISPGGCPVEGLDPKVPYDLVLVEKAAMSVRFEVREEVRACEGSEPGDQRVGAWVVRVSPAEIAGPLGAEVPFEVEVRASPGAVGDRLVAGEWVRLEAGGAVNLTTEGARVTAYALVGAVPRVGVRIERSDLGTTPFHQSEPVEGPRVAVVPLEAASPMGASVNTTALRDEAEVPEGLSVRLESSRAVVTYSLGTIRGYDCSENTSPLGTWGVWNVSGRLRLVGFVNTGSSDACLGDAPPHTPRVVATTGPLPAGLLEVEVHETTYCFCPPPSGWATHRATVTIPGGTG